jgi:hypothetical protein
MPRSGRPRVFDDSKQEVFLRLVAAGFSARQAARHVGVSPSTAHEKARQSPIFAAAYQKAKDQAIPNLLENVHVAGQRSWRASAWLLERLRPAQFGRRVALGVDPTLPRPARQPRDYGHQELIEDMLSRIREFPDVREMLRERLDQIEAQQQAWGVAIRAYRQHCATRGADPGFEPGDMPPGYPDVPPPPESTDAAAPDAGTIDKPPPGDSVAPHVAPDASNSRSSAVTPDSKIPIPQPQPANAPAPDDPTF